MTTPSTASAIDELRRTMRAFHVDAGEPSIRALARDTNMATGTVQSALRTPERSTWVTLGGVAATLARSTFDVAALRNLHRAARAEHEGRPRVPTGDDVVYLVIRSSNYRQPFTIIVGDRHLADATARADMAMLVALPVLADYRSVDPQTTDPIRDADPDDVLQRAAQRNQAALDRLGSD